MFPFPSIPHWGMEQKGNIMGSSNLTSKLYEMAEKELTEFENSLDTVKKAIDAAYELSVKRDILSYIENDLPDEITDPDMQTAIENLIETGSPLAIYYDEWLHNEYDNRMEAISMTADDVHSLLEARNKVKNEVAQFFKNKISDILYYSLSKEQISALTEAINKVPSDEGKIEIAKHFVPQEGAALYDIMCNNPIENELKIIGISPSEIVPTFNSFDNEIELMWKNVSVKLDWQEYAKACFDVVEIATAINSQIPEYTDKINDVEQIADKIQDAIDNTELNIERNEHSVSQER